MKAKTAAAHLVRPAAAPGASRRKVAPSAPVQAYAPGYFTALVTANNWPPQWQPQAGQENWRGDAAASRRASENRHAAIVAGNTWGSGRIELPGTPKAQLMPGWM
jgi:hypothetical protein